MKYEKPCLKDFDERAGYGAGCSGPGSAADSPCEAGPAATGSCSGPGGSDGNGS